MRVAFYQDRISTDAEFDEIEVLVCDVRDYEEITYNGSQKIVTQMGTPDQFSLSAGTVKPWKHGVYIIKVDERRWKPGNVNIKIRTITNGIPGEWSNNLLLHKK